MLDRFGRELQLNDCVCYPVRRGSNLDVKLMHITSLDPMQGLNMDGKTISLTRVDNIVLVGRAGNIDHLEMNRADV